VKTPKHNHQMRVTTRRLTKMTDAETLWHATAACTIPSCDVTQLLVEHRPRGKNRKTPP
jgi:hypothetical protein